LIVACRIYDHRIRRTPAACAVACEPEPATENAKVINWKMKKFSYRAYTLHNLSHSRTFLVDALRQRFRPPRRTAGANLAERERYRFASQSVIVAMSHSPCSW
jgi:hypothetical protein